VSVGDAQFVRSRRVFGRLALVVEAATRRG
jgi:hypothetical protein